MKTIGLKQIVGTLGIVFGFSLLTAQFSLAGNHSGASDADAPSTCNTGAASEIRDAVRRQIAELRKRSGSPSAKLYGRVYADLLRQFGGTNRIELTVAMAEAAPDDTVSIARACVRESCVRTVELHGKLLAILRTAPIFGSAGRKVRMAQLTHSMSQWVPFHRDELFQQLTVELPRVTAEQAVAAASNVEAVKPTEVATVASLSSPGPVVADASAAAPKSMTSLAGPSSGSASAVESTPRQSTRRHGRKRALAPSDRTYSDQPSAVAPVVDARNREHAFSPFIIGVSAAGGSSGRHRSASTANEFSGNRNQLARQKRRVAPRSRSIIATTAATAPAPPQIATPRGTSVPPRAAAIVVPQRNLTIYRVANRRQVSDITNSTAYADADVYSPSTTLISEGTAPSDTTTKPPDTKIALFNKDFNNWDIFTTDGNGDRTLVGQGYTLDSKVDTGGSTFDYSFTGGMGGPADTTITGSVE